MQQSLCRTAPTLLVLLVLAGGASAATCEGIHVPDTVTVAGIPLVRNGHHMCAFTMLRVKLYVMALYLEEPCDSAEAVIASSGAKRVWQRYVRGVDGARITKGWHDSFAKHNASVAGIEQQISQFASSMETVRKGSVFTIDFVDDSVIVTMNGHRKAPVVGQAFQHALLNVWLGDRGVDQTTRRALLGRDVSSR